MSNFTILDETCSTGFYQHVLVNISKAIPSQLRRRIITVQDVCNSISIIEVQRIIIENSSLRIAFGWSFESSAQYEEVVNECLSGLNHSLYGGIVSDLRADWIGFLPFNTFESEAYNHLGLNSLVLFNNNLVNFQIYLIERITKHKLFLQHSFLRNNDYRFQYFKAIRHDPVKLEDAFRFYVNAVKDTIQITEISRNELENQIGCHYLNHPDIFFELLEIFKLKGIVYE